MDKVKIGFPIEYEDENNIVRNGLFLREPEIKELEKRLKEINKITDLKQQCKQQKEVIDKTIEYIRIYRSYQKIDNKDYLKGRDEIGCLDIYQVDELLDILKEVSE